MTRNAPHTSRQVLRTLLPALLVDVALPTVVYLILSGAGLPDLVALAASAVPPALNVLARAIGEHRCNGVGVIVLASIAIGMVTALIAGDPRLALARDAAPNVLIAVALAMSVVVGGRPLVFHLVRACGEIYRPGLRELMEQQWTDNARFRTVLRRATALGAVVLLAESGLRLVAAEVLPVAVGLPVLQVQSFVVWAGLVLVFRRAVLRAVRAGTPQPADRTPAGA